MFGDDASHSADDAVAAQGHGHPVLLHRLGGELVGVFEGPRQGDEDVMARTGWPVDEVIGAVGRLLLSGRVARTVGARYVPR